MAAKSGGTGSKRSKAAQPPEPALSLQRIVATAVELLDADGVSGLTMRKLADCLGSGVMSLYWHVDNKDDMFDLALDAVLAYDAGKAAETKDWRGTIVHMIEDWRARMLRHPWSAALLTSRALGPSILARLELLARMLSKAGVADANLNVAIWSLWNYVMGATVTRTSFGPSDNDKSAAQERLSSFDEHYPTIARSRLLLDDDWDGVFHKGLDSLLDGLASKPLKR